ncbi:MAG TPA: adenosylcobinamide-GDP ribazoletransferase [Candidatus Obscuribacterales bacterium]
MNALKKLALAASFVSCLPLCRLPEDPQGNGMAGLAKYLPAAGMLIGGLLVLIAWLLLLARAEALLLGAILTVCWLMLTGGIHFDGLMDTADGVLSHREPARMLEIMNDSRVGNFGAMTGFCVILLKFASLASLPFPVLLQVLAIVPAWARWCESFTIGAFPYLRKAGMGKIWHDTTQFPQDVIIAALPPLALTAVAAYLGWWYMVLSAVATVVPGLAAAAWLNRILKGHTGDSYGAVVELAETKGLLMLALLVRLPAAPLS